MSNEENVELTDGFHLLIDVLKDNGIDTMYGVVGIPITNLARLWQEDGQKFYSFRAEQHAGYAASIAGYIQGKPGVALTVSAPGFLNGVTALAHATTNCFPMLLLSGSSERDIVDLQQGDYEEMDQFQIAKPHCKASYRINSIRDIPIGIARAMRTALTGRPGGVYVDLPARLFGQTMPLAEANALRFTPAPIGGAAAPEADVARAAEVIKAAKKPVAKKTTTYDGKILVLVPLLDVIDRLKNELLNDSWYNKFNIVTVDGSLPLAVKRRALEEGDLILTTTMSVGTGTDIKNLACVINFDQAASPIILEQVCGRLRDRGKECWFFDITDHVKQAKSFESWGRKRRGLLPYFPGVKPDMKLLPPIKC